MSSLQFTKYTPSFLRTRTKRAGKLKHTPISTVGLSMCCPCITFGANAELLGEDWMLYCLFCILPGPMCYFGPYIRNKIRRAFEIEVKIHEQIT